MYLPNTVHLSLYLLRLSDLFVLLDARTSPVLDHLSVTLIKRNRCDAGNESQPINSTTTTSRLRSLQIRHMALDDLLMFLSIVNMPFLEKLTLIEIHGRSKLAGIVSCIRG